MKRGFKLALFGLVAGGIVIQFFQPDKNMSPPDPEEDLLMLTSPPAQVAELIKSSCYDCHSNQTAYPWYSRVAPVSWYLQKHIKDGKGDVNFSDYGSMDQADRIELLTDIFDVIDAGTMPLLSFALIHKVARLDQEDKDAILDWSEREALKVMKE
jgi:hypothetical protein